jgi:hypothetical protein
MYLSVRRTAGRLVACPVYARSCQRLQAALKTTTPSISFHNYANFSADRAKRAGGDGSIDFRQRCEAGILLCFRTPGTEPRVRAMQRKRDYPDRNLIFADRGQLTFPSFDNVDNEWGFWGCPTGPATFSSSFQCRRYPASASGFSHRTGVFLSSVWFLCPGA